MGQEFLDNEAVIEQLFKRMGSYESAVADRPGQDAKRRLLRNQARSILKDTRPDLDLDQAEALRPLLQRTKWVSDLAEEHRLLSERNDHFEITLKEATEKRESLTRELETIRAPYPKLAELKGAIATARKNGDLEQRLAISQGHTQQAQIDITNELARLGKFSGTIDQLSKLSFPLPEVFHQFEQVFNDLTTQEKEWLSHQKAITADKKQAEQELASLLANTSIPTLEELAASRKTRDDRWLLIKQKYIEKRNLDPSPPEWAIATDLPADFEQNVQASDQLADQLRESSDNVVKRAHYQTQIDDLNRRYTDIIKEIEQVQEAKKTQHGRWVQCWKPLEIEPGTPREMTQWVDKVNNLLAKVHRLQAHILEQQQLQATHEQMKQVMSFQVNQFDPTNTVQEESLEALITLCEQRLEADEKVIADRKNLETLMNEADTQIGKITKELRIVQTRRASWQQEWEQAVEGMGLTSTAHPKQVIVFLEQLHAFFTKFEKSEELSRRIYGIDQRIREFRDQVSSFAASIEYPANQREPDIIASSLHQQLGKARETNASLRKMQDLVKETSLELEQTDMAVRSAQEQLARLMNQAKSETQEALISAGEASKNKREIQQLLASLEQELARNGDGLMIDELEKEALEIDVDMTEATLTAINLEIDELRKRRDASRDTSRSLQDKIATKDGSAEAAAASEEAELHLADMVSGAEKYLRFQIASLLLEQHIEAYRKTNQAPILTRAGALFSRLTLGSFRTLRDDLDNRGKPILFGVRANNDEVTLDGMSEGSRDQLYLSLRLATLEQHLNRRKEPIPFIVDDVLIGFDDSRTGVCLEVLSELAKKTQVLLFTHHRRVLDISHTLNNKEIFTHQLS